MSLRTIDTGKMRDAFASTTAFCQHAYSTKDRDGNVSLCALTALVSYAGVRPELIDTMIERNMESNRWTFWLPVLEATYGITQDVAEEIPRIFDSACNEHDGVSKVMNFIVEVNKSRFMDNWSEAIRINDEVDRQVVAAFEREKHYQALREQLAEIADKFDFDSAKKDYVRECWIDKNGLELSQEVAHMLPNAQAMRLYHNSMPDILTEEACYFEPSIKLQTT